MKGNIFLLAVVLILLDLALINRRYVHFDKAGISYSMGVNTQYIPVDSIAAIQQLNFGFMKVLEIKLEGRTKTRFIAGICRA
jgi:hypothetical protein